MSNGLTKPVIGCLACVILSAYLIATLDPLWHRKMMLVTGFLTIFIPAFYKWSGSGRAVRMRSSQAIRVQWLNKGNAKVFLRLMDDAKMATAFVFGAIILARVMRSYISLFHFSVCIHLCHDIASLCFFR